MQNGRAGRVLRDTPWAWVVVSFLLSPVLTSVLGLAADWARQQYLAPKAAPVFRVHEALPFTGSEGSTAVYSVWIANRGSQPVHNLACRVEVQGGQVDEWDLAAPPILEYTAESEGGGLAVRVPGLNPQEEVTITALATGDDRLPSRPDVSVRAEGVAVVEERGTVQARTNWTGLGIMLGLGMVLGELLGFQLATRRSRAQAGRLSRAPDFEDDFRSGLASWRHRDKMTVASVDEKGLRLGPIPDSAVKNYAEQLYGHPRFADGIIECEVWLEDGALFDLVVRGDVVDEEFYMARLDSREAYWDCILLKPAGKHWRECNKGSLAHHSPAQQRIDMRVEATGAKLLLYRNGDLVDEVRNAQLREGTVSLFAEQGMAFVRAIRIWYEPSGRRTVRLFRKIAHWRRGPGGLDGQPIKSKWR